jgi:hypothetical protein
MSLRRPPLPSLSQRPHLSAHYDPIEHHRLPSYTSVYDADDSYELERFRSYSSAQHLLPNSDASNNRTRPGSTTTSVKGFALSGSGLWNSQMLVDRSFRSMAILTMVLAFIMTAFVFVCLKSFIHRERKTSTSIFANEESCETAGWKITVRPSWISSHR